MLKKNEMPEKLKEDILSLWSIQGKVIAVKAAMMLSQQDMTTDELSKLYDDEIVKLRIYWRDQKGTDDFIEQMEEFVYISFANETMILFEKLGGATGHA